MFVRIWVCLLYKGQNNSGLKKIDVWLKGDGAPVSGTLGLLSCCSVAPQCSFHLVV